MRTPLVDAQIESIAENDKISIADASRQLLASKEPSLRFTRPEDIGDTVLFLCSEAGDNITGTSFSLDGGWTAQ